MDDEPTFDRRPLEPADFVDHGDDPRDATSPDQLLEVDRCYRLDRAAFTEGDWNALMSAYTRLPGWAAGADELPRWFGSEDQVPHLVASVEPPGLQITGCISAELLARWDEAFRERAGSLPVRRPDGPDPWLIGRGD